MAMKAARAEDSSDPRSTNVTPCRHFTPSPNRSSCPENHLPRCDDPGSSLAGPSTAGAPLPSTMREPSLGTRLLVSSDSASSRHAAILVALDFFGNARVNSPPPPRQERYKAVQEMLLFLDAQAEHRVSASSR